MALICIVRAGFDLVPSAERDHGGLISTRRTWFILIVAISVPGTTFNVEQSLKEVCPSLIYR